MKLYRNVQLGVEKRVIMVMGVWVCTGRHSRKAPISKSCNKRLDRITRHKNIQISHGPSTQHVISGDNRYCCSFQEHTWNSKPFSFFTNLTSYQKHALVAVSAHLV